MSVEPRHDFSTREQGNGLGMRWAALCEAGNVVASLAGVSPQAASSQLRNFPALMRQAEPRLRALAESGVADLAAVMEPGLAALLAVSARGGDCRAAALALWNEFAAAQAALLALVPATGPLGPMRRA